jgi:hypothetical protein
VCCRLCQLSLNGFLSASVIAEQQSILSKAKEFKFGKPAIRRRIEGLIEFYYLDQPTSVELGFRLLQLLQAALKLPTSDGHLNWSNTDLKWCSME